MKIGLPTPPACSLVVSVQRVTLHGLQLSISIIVSRLLVHRFDNVTACTVHCIHSNGSVATSAEVTGPHEGAEAGVSRVRALCGCRKSVEVRGGSRFRCAAPKVVQRLSLGCI